MIMEKNRKGRPSLDLNTKLERSIAREYKVLQKLRAELLNELSRQHPSLESAQIGELIRPIMASAEEYRVWSELDNQLLSVQRHQTPKVRYEEIRLGLIRHVQKIRGDYSFVLKSRGDELNKIACDVSIESFGQLVSDSSNLSSGAQTQHLYQVSILLEKNLSGPLSLVEIKGIRTLLRKILDLIKHQRLSLLYTAPDNDRAGRPSIPLPILIIRAEQRVIDSHLQLSHLLKQVQLPILSPKTIYLKHKLNNNVGRPKLTEEQRLTRDLRKKENELNQIINSKTTPVEAQTKKANVRGRRPLSYEQKCVRLRAQIAELREKLNQCK